MANTGPLSHDEFVSKHRQRALAIAIAILHNRVGPTTGARLLSRCQGRLGFSHEDEFKLLVPFIGLDSETDHLPLGSERAFWAADALERSDAEVARYDAFWGSQIKEACRRFIEVVTPLVPASADELDVVATVEEIVGNDYYLPEGSRGTVVHVHLDPTLAYLVEFCNAGGKTQALLSLTPSQVKLVWKAPSA